jgi:hypothetical protein
VSLFHESLENFYKSNFNLMFHHKFSLTELDDMMPWEREVYVIMLNNYFDELKNKS